MAEVGDRLVDRDGVKRLRMSSRHGQDVPRVAAAAIDCFLGEVYL
jgi:hypothetical protein